MTFRTCTTVVFAAILISLMTSCGNYYNVLSKPKIDDGITYGRVELPEPDMEPFHFTKRPSNVELPALEKWADKKAKELVAEQK